jgi:hypothetical protein
MAGNFEIDVNGDVKAEVGIRAIQGRRDKIETLIYRAARAGAEEMRQTVPNRKGGMERSIRAEFPRFLPGGAGGGGTWQASFGPTRTAETVRDGWAYPTNVFRGTGLYGPRDRYIRPTRKRAMRFDGAYYGRKGWIFAKYIRGQKPNRLWYDLGVARANSYVSRNLHRVFKDETIS